MTFPNRTVVAEHISGGLVSLPEVRSHLSLFDDTTFDTYLSRLVTVATGHVGEILGTSLEDRELVDYYSRFSNRMYLSAQYIDGPPIVSYRDSTHALVIASADTYIIDDTAGRTSLYFFESTPSGLSTRFSNPVQIAYAQLNEVLEDQEEIKQAILMMVGDMFKNRENDVETAQNRVNITMDRLLRPHRSNFI